MTVTRNLFKTRPNWLIEPSIGYVFGSVHAIKFGDNVIRL